MKKPGFHKILDVNRFAYAYLNTDLSIQFYNEKFVKYALIESVSNEPISSVIPETLGLESIFSEILEGEKSYFSLRYLQRDFDEQKKVFDVYLFPSGYNELPLLCLIKESATEAEQKRAEIQKQNEMRLVEQAPSALTGFIRDAVIGESQHIERVREVIAKICHFPNLTVLLQGESGTGKNLVARVLHEALKKDDEPFIEINCAAIPETLLESELFGHVKGAYTNASSDKKGLLEEADKGTLFLDEIGEVPVNVQVKLLNFLESRKFRPLGSTMEKEVDIRLITASNKDLKQMVKENRFRQDLFYRLNVVRIEMPPLRLLGQDIITISRHFLELFNMKFDKNLVDFDPEARQALSSYNWPGNIRELRNVIERSVVFASGDKIKKEDLIFDSPLQMDEKQPAMQNILLTEDGLSLTDLEKSILQQALEISKGNQTKAAKLLQISRETLRYRIEKYNLR